MGDFQAQVFAKTGYACTETNFAIRPSQIRQTPINYKVLRPTKLAEELGQKSKKKEGKRLKSRHRGKGAKTQEKGP